MRYRELRVPPPLDAFVECVWFLTTASEDVASTAGAPALPERILPDGCIELVCHVGEPFLAVSTTGSLTAQPACFVVGILTSPLFVQAADGAETIGVRFRPGGAYPFFPCPIAAFTDGSVGLDDVWGPAAHQLWNELAAAGSDAARVGIISRALLERLGHADRDRITTAAIGALVATAGRARIEAIARRVGVTPRHLQRRFRDRVGVSPKVLARILRFQNTLRRRTSAAGASGTAIDWVRVAVECGYSDQSHLIHDYAVFAGETPASLIAAESELSAYFTAPQRLAALFGERRYG